MKSFLKYLLIALQIGLGLSSITGGIALTLTHGLGMPVSILSDSMFTSFFYPGLILTIIVGGSQAAAAVLMVIRHRHHYFFAGLASFALLIWIYVELYITHTSHWLQTLYFGLGVLEMILILLILIAKSTRRQGGGFQKRWDHRQY